MDPIAVVSHREVPPDPSIADAVGTRHELPTALADLVDNAVDAGASRVHVRFLTSNGTLTGLLVTDDGRGMDEAAIDAAMTFARRRDYGERDLGHYGLGLKAASLSQADVLDVLSRAVGGVPVGRRIARDRPTRVETLDPRQVGESLAAPLFRIPGAAPSHGTVVRWHGLRTVLTAPDPGERARWLSECIEEVRAYLGLVFHRILQRADIKVSIDEFDLGTGEAGAMRGVRALDPLARSVTGVRSTPLDGAVNGRPFKLTAVVLTEDAFRDPAVRASVRARRHRTGRGSTSTAGTGSFRSGGGAPSCARTGTTTACGSPSTSTTRCWTWSRSTRRRAGSSSTRTCAGRCTTRSAAAGGTRASSGGPGQPPHRHAGAPDAPSPWWSPAGA